ncbi:MAG TPA: carbamoyltransferase C-terminal domain-containing protein [Pyrinomonadaceae bacterium]|nr:carbamoyltransferase C-terminal domain-containing protein [Pyrinomonadaceae bacterium]
MYILGLTTLGDSAATLLRDGEIVAAAEEERFSRRKHHSGFPYHAMQYCLEEAGIGIKDVEHIGLYWKPWILRHKALQALKSGLISRDMFKARADRGVAQVSQSYLGMLRHPKLIRKHFGPSDFRFHFLEHHQCHAASSFFVSGFDTSAILTWDGTGEDTTTLFSRSDGQRIEVLKRIKLPHSLGQFYSAVTNFIGFDMFGGDEWKVMGLAAYGKPVYYDFFRERVLSVNGNYDFNFNIRVLDHHLAKHYQFGDEISRALGPPRQPDEDLTERHWNIAASAQKVLEDTALHLIKGLHEMTGEENLCMAGGVAFNSVMNGRIMTESPFKNYYVQPAAGDAGCSLGAALMVHHTILRQPRTRRMEHAYYGPGFTSAECAAELSSAGLKFETLEDSEMLPRVAQMIADGAIIGWFQGRMEFGPRALGNRSFIADPRRYDMRELLNKKVKLREWFRPLAPSMKEEVSEEIFGRPHYDPFMVTVLHVTEEQRARFPSVVHIDGTARPQTVSRRTNPRYWNLIDEFERLTGCPMLLNTSFNIQEPIVCRPSDAIKTFQGANFDALVLENHLVLRKQ